jgi:hypothetical protein
MAIVSRERPFGITAILTSEAIVAGNGSYRC